MSRLFLARLGGFSNLARPTARTYSQKSWIEALLSNNNAHPGQTDLKRALLTKRSHESGDLLPYIFAKDFIHHYHSTSDKASAIVAVTSNFGVDSKKVEDKIKKLNQSLLKEKGSVASDEHELSLSLEPAYKHLLIDISKQPGGVKFLVDLRADLLKMFRSGKVKKCKDLRRFELCLKKQLADWFADGFMDLQNVTWENTDARFIEKLMNYEAVHPVESWEDMKHRMGTHRRVFVFSHRLLPHQPVVLLHTLLGTDIPTDIHSVLRQPNDVHLPREQVRTVTFYSISSTQRGLDGIGLGNLLIKRVVQELQKDFPNLNTFVTLSPVPKFRRWLDRHLTNISLTGERPSSFDHLTVEQCKQLKSSLEDEDWLLNNSNEKIKSTLLTLCTKYLINEKKRGFALDPVAHFHLRNGATLWRVNWLANQNSRGMTSSYGIMVNYMYELEKIAQNNYTYLVDSRIQMSSRVERLLDGQIN